MNGRIPTGSDRPFRPSAHCEFLPASQACVIESDGRRRPACRATLDRDADGFVRRFVSMHLSRPEHYFSLYQSGCNLDCAKCHSADFSQSAQGHWVSTADLGVVAADYASKVNWWEPRERATMYHAEDLCRGCGSCLLAHRRSPMCPERLSREEVVLSPQGFGPARNIVAFTGGDLTCVPEYYAEAARRIKEADQRLFVLVETNGYALDERALKILAEGGVDAFWLDIKAFDRETHVRLTGSDNRRVLKLPALMKRLGFTVEVLTLLIPGWVEADQVERIAALTAEADPKIPMTVLAFFPTHRMKDVRAATFEEMAEACERARSAGIENLRAGNMGVFCSGNEQIKKALEF